MIDDNTVVTEERTAIELRQPQPGPMKIRILPSIGVPDVAPMARLILSSLVTARRVEAAGRGNQSVKRKAATG